MDNRVIIAEDHPLFRTALEAALRQALETVAITEASSIASLQNAIATEANLDLILLDLNMPGAHGFSGLLHIVSQLPKVPVLVISSQDDETVIRKAIGYGATGFISKASPMSSIRQAIQHVIKGKRWIPDNIDMSTDTPLEKIGIEDKIATLTSQQFRVLGMISEGMLNKQIAWELSISEATVKAHVTAIFRKLGVRNRTQAVITLNQLELDSNAPSATD